MKNRFKKLRYPTLFLLILMAAFHVKINTNNNALTSISLLNIETLSYAENTVSKCYGTGSIDCSTSKEKVSYVVD